LSANFDQAFRKISSNFFRAEFENPFKKANLNEQVWEMYRKNEPKDERIVFKLNEYSISENESVECKLNKNKRRKKRKRKEKVTKI